MSGAPVPWRHFLRFICRRCAAILSAFAWTVGSPVGALAAGNAQFGPAYANLHGEVVLDNARVFVQKFVVAPDAMARRPGLMARGG